MDFTAVTSDIEKSVIQLRKSYPERSTAKIAIVVSGDLAYGMSRMYEALSDDLPQIIRVFKEYSVANDWVLS